MFMGSKQGNRRPWLLIGASLLAATSIVSTGLRGEPSAEPARIETSKDIPLDQLPSQIQRPGPGDTDWPSFNKRIDGQRFSELTAITPETVGSLEEACRVQVSGMGPFSAGSILVGGAIYSTAGRATLALDPVNCNVIWKSIYTPDEVDVHSANRGAAYWKGMIIRGTGDARIVAYDAATGHEIWRRKTAEPTKGEYIVSAPIIWEDRIFVGLAGGDFGITGRMMAFDAKTGEKLWSFNTIPFPGEFGHDTWPGDTWKTGGGGTWSSFSLDPATGELYVPVANPGPDFDARIRRGDNLYSNSILVLDARTGKRVWHYQTLPNDGHDYGVAPPAVLIDRDARKYVAQGSKDGYLYMLDRVSHKLLWKTPVTTILNHRVDATPEGIKVCPGVKGGVSYNSPAYDPSLGLIVVGSVDVCSKILAIPYAQHVPGQPYTGGGVGGTGDESKDGGWVMGVDAMSGKIRWQYKTPAPIISGITPTAGGVTFAGDTAGALYAFRTADGKLLRTIQLGGAIAGGIITYRIRDQHYVAVNFGNISRSSWGAVSGMPSMVVFRLPSMTAKAAQDPATLTPDIAHGRTVYATSCAACHGAGGQGGEGAKLIGMAAKYSQAAAVAYIANPKPPMPKFYPDVLSAQDLADVAGFIRTFPAQ